MADYSNKNTTPLSPWTYFWLNLLYAIPIVGVVFLLIHAIGAPNINKRNYARSFFCWLVILLIIFIISAISGGAASLFSWLSGLFNK